MTITRIADDKEHYPTQSAAKRAVENLRAEINARQDRVGSLTVKELWGHFQANELHDPDVDRSPTTIELYQYNFKKYLLPKWGDTLITEMKAVEVERWLRSLQYATATKSKLRNQLSMLFSHAIRHELYDRLNPISAVRQAASAWKPRPYSLFRKCNVF